MQRRRGATRFTISLPAELAQRLDEWVTRRNSRSRSDAIRFLVGRELAEENVSNDPDSDALAAVVLLYRHEAPKLLDRLAEAEHRWGDHVRSSVHAHLEGEACVELLLLAGSRGELEEATADLRGVKGLKDGRSLFVSPATAGGRSGHHHPHKPR